MTSDFAYEIFSLGVVSIANIKWLGQKEIHLTKAECLVAIENIKKERALYKTEEAFQKELGKFQGALDYLETSLLT